MPTSIWRAAVAAGTLRPAAKASPPATNANLRNDRLPSRGAEHPPQPVLELHLGLPPEQLPRPRDVGLAHLRVVDRERLVDDLALRPRDAQDRLGQLVERELVRVPEVDGQMLARLGEQHE